MLDNTLPSFVPVLIVGAGPAGATASLMLSKIGIPHLIIDKATFPRDKVCGDGLDLKIPRILRHINPLWVDELLADETKFLPNWGVRLGAPNRKYHDSVYQPKDEKLAFPPFVTAKRFTFDHFLIQKIPSPHSDFRQGATLKTLRKIPTGFEVDILYNNVLQTVACNLLLGADGDHSTILRCLGERKIDRQHYASSLRVYYKGVQGFHDKNLIEVHFRKQLPVGYFWIFPMPNGEANVGLGIQSNVANQRNINLNHVFEQLITQEPDFKERFSAAEPLESVKGWGIPFASRKRKVLGDNYLLLGDAASMVNPLNGEGIGTAMMSGYIAAMYARRAVESGRFGQADLAGYQEEVSARLNDEIRTYNYALQFNHKTWFFPVLTTLFALDMPRSWFTKSMHQWADTALYRPIKLSID